MTKYAVRYKALEYFGEQIHVFADSPEEAIITCCTEGVGYFNNHTVYPNKILSVSEIVQSIPIPDKNPSENENAS